MLASFLMHGGHLMQLSNLFRAMLLASAAVSLPAFAQAASPPPLATAVSGWVNPGGDLPVDPAWRLGTLPNGLRYAVRRSSQPAGAISVRVRIGAGALMEADLQQGWSHLLEHMVFRGTGRYADGEGIKLWQRLGATFGSDTNAETTLTSTTFQLDLPRADPAAYGQAMAVLADMMDTARIDPALLTTERQVVNAERAQRLSPLVRKVQDAQKPLLYAGTKAATRDIIGTAETLAGATPAALKAYYETWYRPENAVVVVAGDADPAVLEAEIRRAFGGWKGTGPAPAAPDWGAPAKPAMPAATLTDPQVADTVALSFVAPHPERPFTIARQQEQYAELIAVGILNQRLSAAAQQGGAIVNATAQRPEQRHVEDQLIVQVQPKPGQWQAALNQTYAVLNGALAAPPAQAEVDQQIAGLTSYLQQRSASASTQTAPALANDFVKDVDQGDVTGAPEYYARLLSTSRAALKPAAIQAVIKRLLAPESRMLVLGPQPVAGGPGAAVQALASAQKVAGGAAAQLRAVSLDQLVLPGKPSAAAAPVAITPLGAERVRFGNGVELVFKRTPFEKDRARVRVEVGQGLVGEARNSQGLWWTAPALLAAGIGPYSAEELARVVAGRQIAFAVAPALHGIALTGATNGADVGDMLKLMTGEIVAPRFDASTVDRVREATLANYASVFSQPVAVLQLFGGAALHGGDRRFDALPPRAEIAALSLPGFQRFWTERLAQGPVRVVVVGDVDRATVVAAVARTLGTLAPRPAAALSKAGDVRATSPAAPVVLHHQGDPGQALVARAYPTLGQVDDRSASAALDLAASLIQVRLTEGFRAAEGGSYSPLALHDQSSELPHYGVLLAGAQVQAARVEGFGRSLDTVLADLVKNGPSADAFARAQATAVSAAGRSREDNGWWLAVLGTDLSPARVAALAGRVDELKALAPPDIQRAAARFLSAGRGFTIEVLPSQTTGK